MIQEIGFAQKMRDALTPLCASSIGHGEAKLLEHSVLRTLAKSWQFSRIAIR